MIARTAPASSGSAIYFKNAAAKAARTPLPAPGIVWGNYPERRNRKPSSAITRMLARLLAPLLNGKLSSRGHQNFVAGVRALQQQIADESAALLNARISHLRARLARDGFHDASNTEAFAVVAVYCRRTLGVELYDTQLIAARIMLDNHLAEMATGEGKTLAAALTAATAALAGIPVHVVTANDYLVSRDAANLRPLYEALGLTVGTVTQPMAAPARQAAYACGITYCTAKELVFDYLRDGVSAPQHSAIEQRAAALAGAPAPQRLLRGLCMAIIDEADSILIDEARVPLVLSRAVPDSTQVSTQVSTRVNTRVSAHQALQHAWKLSAMLDPATHFIADGSTHSTRLTAEGRAQVHELCTRAAAETFNWMNRRHCEDQVALALTARYLLQRGRDFVVEDGRVHIVDATTGRKAAGRSWSNGLHQLVEIKAGCAPSAQVETLAQITYQRFFPRYFRLCGMSGTLREARRELHNIYDLHVVNVPLHRPLRRTLLPARVFANAEAQWSAVVTRARRLHEQGRPLLIGTGSVLDSEDLSRRLSANGLTHVVLNAQQDRQEAEIIAAAGAPEAITVATNMAGRGTDIVLAAASRDAGGLHVICCQQNAARRIDRQLLGRCARQGDPGSAEYFISLEGPMLGRIRIAAILNISFKNNILYNLPLYGSALPLLRLAQRAAERRHEVEREALMRQDQRMGDWFAFSGPEQ